MKYFIIVAIISLIALSCAIEHKDYQDGEISPGSEVVDHPQAITSEANTIANSICYNFKSKRSSNFPALEEEARTFLFNLKRVDCDDVVVTDSLVSSTLELSDSGPMIFKTSYRGDFFKEVETEKNGLLSSVCDSVLMGRVPINRVEYLKGHLNFSFYSIDESFDGVSIYYSEENEEEEKHLVVYADYLKIYKSTNDFHTGMVKERSRKTYCVDSDGEDSVETITQTSTL